MKNYNKIAQTVVEHVGGLDNIDSVTNCMTRLRFVLKDDSKANEKALNSMNEVSGVVNKNGQYQVVIGTDVANVCDEIKKMKDFDASGQSNNKKKDSLINRVIGAITAIFQPIIPAICGAGMIRAILAILVALNWVDTASSTYIILNMVADTAFYFLPVFLAYSAAKVFNCSPYLAAVMGAILIHPTFTGLVAAGESISLWGLPVRLVSYGSQVVPPILIVWIMSYIEKYAKKWIPSAVSVFMVPLVVFMITAPIAFCVAGPLGSYIGDILYVLFEYLNSNAGWVIPFLMGTFAPLLVMTGMHYSITPIALAQFASVGYMTILSPGMLASNIAQATATLYVGLKTKNKKLKQTALSSSVTAYFGITEPALYGVTLPLKKPLISTMIGGAAAGLWAGLSHMRTYASASAGILAFPVYIGGDDFSNVMNAGICMVIAFVVSLVASFIIGFDDIPEKEQENQVETKTSEPLNCKSVVYSPLKGKVLPLSEVNDEVFSKKIMGEGIAILPEEGVVTAPFDGVINTVFPTKHAIGLTSNDGVELIIHVGLDTVELNGECFSSLVKDGDTVKKGDVLVSFDLDKIKEREYDTITPVVITNPGTFIDIIETDKKQINREEELLNIFK